LNVRNSFNFSIKEYIFSRVKIQCFLFSYSTVRTWLQIPRKGNFVESVQQRRWVPHLVDGSYPDNDVGGHQVHQAHVGEAPLQPATN
jgi:hypothetical protein